LKQLFLPLGLLSAIVCALLLPGGGIFISANSGTRILVFIIFLVSGYQTGTKAFPLDRQLFNIVLTAAGISLFLAPLLGFLLIRLVDFSSSLAMGFIIISAVPPTISSGIVITEVSRGNAVLALFITISLNLLGIFIMPFTLDLCLKAAGPVDIDQTALLFKMIFFVLLPFAVGKFIRNTRDRSRVSANWSYVNSACVILVVYSSLSTSRGVLAGLGLSEYAMVLAGVAVLHCLLLIITAQAGKMLHLVPADHKALVFVSSQKTLAIGLAVLTNIRYDTGSAIIVCLVFHFFQLFIDSFLAAYVQKR
jgi:sodium/bile acid cotransporter 7